MFLSIKADDKAGSSNLWVCPLGKVNSNDQIQHSDSSGEIFNFCQCSLILGHSSSEGMENGEFLTLVLKESRGFSPGHCRICFWI